MCSDVVWGGFEVVWGGLVWFGMFPWSCSGHFIFYYTIMTYFIIAF